ncbi:rhomboid family intramembrane serine protease [Flavobacteriaceae bacterium]|uniref:rhomboid family intramembrane serine protease n=1 Tax=Candidatus Arcticimaribacter forsetii TaxID=2820661 RepID=UPI00207735C3|nr:rhomboid family intramembrane serine protease [Candidatus Arcticimaribacter forsetii]MDB2346069.1 rhomboid family intramembrane serine protease [Flavobacteriaceae bacterium]MDB2456736.1 rhomboid family intramembrane serine protease [Flavobacteriaceae bacterium]
MMNLKNLKYRFEQFSIAEKIIVLNIVFFIIPFFIQTLLYLFKLPSSTFSSWFHLLPSFSEVLFRPWTLFTYSFLHASFSHILWNMLLLYYASQMYLNLFSEHQFLKNYVLGVLVGGLFFLIGYNLFPVFEGIYPPLVGASAGVMAVLIFVATYTPNQEIRLLFINVKLQYIGIALVLIDILQIPYSNAGGRLAHLGGAFIGYLYATQLKQGTDIGSFLDRIWSYFNTLTKPSAVKNMRTVHRTQKTVKRKPSPTNQQKIDAILDKISTSGYESLKQEEKDFLFQSGKDN